MEERRKLQYEALARLEGKMDTLNEILERVEGDVKEIRHNDVAKWKQINDSRESIGRISERADNLTWQTRALVLGILGLAWKVFLAS